MSNKIVKNKYPISREFGIYKLYKIPFNDIAFKNADKLMSILPKTLKETKKMKFIPIKLIIHGYHFYCNHYYIIGYNDI